MKRDFKTNVFALPEFYAAISTAFLALAIGAMFTKWIDADWIYYVGTFGAAIFGLMQSRLSNRSGIKASREEHLDALRWRAHQAGQEFPIIEDVKRLRDEGRKIEAIKLYRQLHPDADLRAALDAVDLM